MYSTHDKNYLYCSSHITCMPSTLIYLSILQNFDMNFIVSNQTVPRKDSINVVNIDKNVNINCSLKRSLHFYVNKSTFEPAMYLCYAHLLLDNDLVI